MKNGEEEEGERSRGNEEGGRREMGSGEEVVGSEQRRKRWKKEKRRRKKKRKRRERKKRRGKTVSHSVTQSVGADATPSGLVSFFGSLVRETINKGYACLPFMPATLLARANSNSSFTLCVIYLLYFYFRKKSPNWSSHRAGWDDRAVLLWLTPAELSLITTTT